MQHPANRRAHQRRGQQLPDPRISQHFAQRQYQPLSRRIHRHISRVPDHMKCFEVHPHRVRRIGQPPVRKSIRRQQITEFIVIMRQRGAQENCPQAANHEQTKPHQKNTKPFLAGNLLPKPLDPPQPQRFPQPRKLDLQIDNDRDDRNRLQNFQQQNQCSTSAHVGTDYVNRLCGDSRPRLSVERSSTIF